MKKIMLTIISFAIFNVSAKANDNNVWEKNRVEQGRRLIRIAGCNDCHTPMYSQLEGKVPEKDWLIGSEVGYSGPWGISYAGNLRVTAAAYQEKAFVAHLRQKKYLPPMPGFMFKFLTDEELGSVYAFIKQLGSVGKRGPVNIPPSQKPKGAFINFVPQVSSN